MVSEAFKPGRAGVSLRPGLTHLGEELISPSICIYANKAQCWWSSQHSPLPGKGLAAVLESHLLGSCPASSQPGLLGWETKSQNGRDTSFQRAREAGQGFLGRIREGPWISWVWASYLLLWAEGEGPSGHKTQEGHLPITALVIWRRGQPTALTLRGLSSNPHSAACCCVSLDTLNDLSGPQLSHL